MGGKPFNNPGSNEGGIPYGLGITGEEANLIRSISDSWRRLVFALLFWNQILTCVSVSLSEAENSARSAMLRYCLARNFFSRAESCCVVKGVRGFRLGLCFRSVHLSGPRLGLGMSGPEMEESEVSQLSSCSHSRASL